MNVVTHPRRRWRPTRRQRLHHLTAATIDAAGYGTLLFAVCAGVVGLAYLTLSLWFAPSRWLLWPQIATVAFAALSAVCGLVMAAAVSVAANQARHAETETL